MAQEIKALGVFPIVALALIAGCSSTGGTIRAGSVPAAEAPANESAAPAVARPTPGGVDPGGAAVPPPARNPGIVSLQNQAVNERDAGELERSAATLERAIRIAPDDPSLWLDLGEVRLAQGRPEIAAGLARRSAALAAGDAMLRNRAEALLERSSRVR